MWNNEKASHEKTGLHPLLTAAAISVTVLSAVGVGAMTGLLPDSFGSADRLAPEAIVSEAPRPAPAPQVEAPKVAEMPPATPKATPRPAAPKVVTKKTVVAQAPSPAAQPPAAIEKPSEKPQPAGTLGVVESVREVKEKAAESNGVGPIAGGVGGAVVGSAIGKSFGSKGMRNVLTVLGAAGGALAGKEIERNVRATTHWEIAVRLDDGSYQTLTSKDRPFWNAGDRVRYLDGRLQPV